MLPNRVSKPVEEKKNRQIEHNQQQHNIMSLTEEKWIVKNKERNGTTRRTLRPTTPKLAVRIPVSIPS